MKQRLACLVLVEIRDSMHRPPIPTTAEMLRRESIILCDQESAIKMIEDMLDAGHRYQNLEAKIHPGICLALGKASPES